ncbi:putative FtsW-like protein [Streptomyces sp. RB5]|uniref:Putative FtsW-like protein n=1 Tax=Streptomyces smaragdinus TaxID=2585196 RepID=A0A7K0CL23_9ACTN|nr:FtsW/RodA/SpoVE family cell cycle protein [Streptomyces smaragdinus]MQY13692.1 putative FtsW-like protein [Streptomyces smaragdinus]
MTTTAEAPPAQELPVRRRTGASLLLLALAVAVTWVGYAASGVALTGRVPPDAWSFAAFQGALGLLALGAVHRLAPYADPLLLPVPVLLNGLGLILIHRLDAAAPGRDAAPAQLLWSMLGMGVFLAVLVLLPDHRWLARRATWCAAAALALMAAPIFFPPVNGARIWVHFGGFSLQPGEFAKVLLAVFFAAYLSGHRQALTYVDGRRIRGIHLPPRSVLGPILAVWLVSLTVLLLERDLGASLLFFGLFVVMLYVATSRPGWIAVGVLLSLAGACVVGTLEPHVGVRVADWLAPFAGIEDGRGASQLAQSLFAFGHGGLLGTGLGQGDSVLIGFAGTSDFILATAGEELGLSGLTALLLLYALLVSRGLRAGITLRGDDFGTLLATGLAVIVALQAFVISAGVTGLIPLTGMAMPFLAQGGSSVVTNWAIVALLVRLSNAAGRPGARTEVTEAP